MIIRVRHSRLSQWIITSVALPLASLPVSASPEGMQIQLCSADGAAKTLTIPLDRHDGNDSCAKPCHACLNRKKNIKSR